MMTAVVEDRVDLFMKYLIKEGLIVDVDEVRKVFSNYAELCSTINELGTAWKCYVANGKVVLTHIYKEEAQQLLEKIIAVADDKTWQDVERIIRTLIVQYGLYPIVIPADNAYHVVKTFVRNTKFNYYDNVRSIGVIVKPREDVVVTGVKAWMRCEVKNKVAQCERIFSYAISKCETCEMFRALKNVANFEKKYLNGVKMSCI